MKKIHLNATESAWCATSTIENNFPELINEIEVDVAIIGGGITGITAALELTKKNKTITVAVLEAYTVGSGTTGNSTGNLYIPTQPLYQNILANFDQETVTAIAQFRKEAIDYIETTVNENAIDCHFARRNWYLYTNNQDNIKKLNDRVLQNAGIKKCEGKTIIIDGEKYAAYRDAENKLHVVSAVCTHMKCIVNWNKEEITWDCPCHGSRFTIDGEVIEGPAYIKLKTLNIKEE